MLRLRPQERDPAAPRRSYTQLEYDIARELKELLYTFLCAPDFPYDAHDPEPADLHALQDAHRAALAAGDSLYLPVRDPRELSERVRELQTRVESLARDLQKTRHWLGRGIAVAVVALLCIAGLLYGVKRQGEAGQRQAAARAAQAEQRASQAISEEELQNQPADEKTDVRALLVRVEAGSAAAEAKVSEWRKLKRETLTKLGDAENTAGHYAATLEPYRQALALTDRDGEPRVWCNAAGSYEYALWQMGRYGEAEPLAREVSDKRTNVLGKEHPNTLWSVFGLANVLFAKGDDAGAEMLYRRCLEAWERTSGKEHPSTAMAAAALSAMEQKRGKLREALPLAEEAVAAAKASLPENHPYRHQCKQNLADLRAKLAAASLHP